MFWGSWPKPGPDLVAGTRAPHLALLCCTSLLHAWNPMNPAGAPENCVEKINTSTRSQHVYKIWRDARWLGPRKLTEDPRLSLHLDVCWPNPFFPMLTGYVGYTHTPYSLKSNPWTTFPCLRGLCPSYSCLWSYEACPSYSWWSPKSPQDTHEFGLHHLSVSSLSKDMTNAGTTSLFNRKPLVKGHPYMIDHQFLSGFILPPTSKFRSEIIRRATYYSYSTWSEAKPYLQTDLGYSPETSPLVNNFLRSVSLLERLYLVTEIHSRSSS